MAGDARVGDSVILSFCHRRDGENPAPSKFFRPSEAGGEKHEAALFGILGRGIRWAISWTLFPLFSHFRENRPFRAGVKSL